MENDFTMVVPKGHSHRTVDQYKKRISVQFDGQCDINAEILDCAERLVDVKVETTVPHLGQKPSLSLSGVEISENPIQYMRNPDKPLQMKRLLLIVNGKRPAIVY